MKRNILIDHLEKRLKSARDPRCKRVTESGFDVLFDDEELKIMGVNELHTKYSHSFTSIEMFQEIWDESAKRFQPLVDALEVAEANNIHTNEWELSPEELLDLIIEP